MKSNNALSVLSVLGILIWASSSWAQGIVPGDSTALGDGMVRVWSDTLGNGIPNQIAVTFGAGALTNLPQTMTAYALGLPDIGPASPFRHVFLAWNPGGHDPEPIYGVPHFDLHYYVIPSQQRAQIPAGTDPVPVDAQFMPANYANMDGHFSVPGMGVHYVDTTSAEFHGQPFTTTVIYGFYQGDFIFVEPMITRVYLQSEPDTTIAIPQPAAYQVSGYYPTSYSIVHSAVDSSVTVALEGFVYRTALSADPQPVVVQPKDYVMLKNYPNPFNPQTTIVYSLPQSSPVTLKVFNVQGQVVATLVDGIQSQGEHSAAFDARELSSGVYLCRLQAGKQAATQKLLLLK